MSIRMLSVVVAALIVAGCGTNEVELADVTGVVMMDGRPLPQAVVRFIPQQAALGRPSSGVTDEEGRYELGYSADETGAIVGPASVEITTGDSQNLREYPETVPAKYNTETTLTREVESGSNEFDFDLESK